MGEVVADGFGVYDEWGPLREVFVGRADTARWPHWDEGLSVASEPVQQSIKQHPGELLADVWPDFAREYQEQLDGLAAV